MGFGKLIKKLRLDKNIGLREFAGRIGVTAGYLSKIEKEQAFPPEGSKISKMAEALGIDPNVLFHAAHEDINKVQDESYKKKDKDEKKNRSEEKKVKRLPPEVYEAYTKDEVYMQYVPSFLRTASKLNLSKDEWEKLIKDLKKKEKKSE